MLLDGEDVTRRAPQDLVARGVCHVPEGRGVFPSLTVRENLLLQSRPRAARPRRSNAPSAPSPGSGSGSTSSPARCPAASSRCSPWPGPTCSRPTVVLLDEVSMGLAPKIVDEIFEFLRTAGRRRHEPAAGRAVRDPGAGGRRLRLPARPRGPSVSPASRASSTPRRSSPATWGRSDAPPPPQGRCRHAGRRPALCRDDPRRRRQLAGRDHLRRLRRRLRGLGHGLQPGLPARAGAGGIRPHRAGPSLRASAVVLPGELPVPRATDWSACPG